MQNQATLRGGTIAAHHLCIVRPSTYKAIPRDFQQLPLLALPSEKQAVLNYINRLRELTYGAPVEPFPNRINSTAQNNEDVGKISNGLINFFLDLWLNNDGEDEGK